MFKKILLVIVAPVFIITAGLYIWFYFEGLKLMFRAFGLLWSIIFAGIALYCGKWIPFVGVTLWDWGEDLFYPTKYDLPSQSKAHSVWTSKDSRQSVSRNIDETPSPSFPSRHSFYEGKTPEDIGAFGQKSAHKNPSPTASDENKEWVEE